MEEYENEYLRSCARMDAVDDAKVKRNVDALKMEFGTNTRKRRKGQSPTRRKRRNTTSKEGIVTKFINVDIAMDGFCI